MQYLATLGHIIINIIFNNYSTSWYVVNVVMQIHINIIINISSKVWQQKAHICA